MMELAKWMNDAGLIALVANDSPYDNDREIAQDIIGKEYIEVYVNGPAGNGPGNSEIEIDTSKFTIEEGADYVVKRIIKYLINESSHGQFLNF